jgi:hypothetical protein
MAMVRADEEGVFGGLPGAVVAVEDDGLISFANAEALRLLQWDGALVGMPLTTIIPDRLQRRHLHGFHDYVKTGVSHLQGGTVRVPARLRDGTERDLDLTIRVFRRPDGTKLVAAALSAAPLGKAPPGVRVLEDALALRLYKMV